MKKELNPTESSRGWLSWLVSPLKIHSYNSGGTLGSFPGAPAWQCYCCTHCNALSGLDAWQLTDMPLTMADCPQGRKLNLLARVWIRLSHVGINCWRPNWLVAVLYHGPWHTHATVKVVR